MDLKTLTDFNAVSGHEACLRKALLQELRAMEGITVSIDRIGNLIAEKAGADPEGKKIMVTAHLDEPGFIVTGATEDGFLKVHAVGHIDPRMIVSKKVSVGDDKVPGIIGALAIHLQSPADRERVLDTEDLFIDIGASGRKEAESIAPLGTRISFDSEYECFGDSCVSGKALDSRAGVMALMSLLNGEYRNTLCAVFTANRETGCLNAGPAAYRLDPDAAIVLDTIAADDLGLDEEAPEPVCRLGKGVVISVSDKGLIAPPKMLTAAVRAAESRGIPCQIAAAVPEVNDGGPMHQSRAGVPTIVLSVPCRCRRSPAEIMSLSDLDGRVLLAQELLNTL